MNPPPHSAEFPRTLTLEGLISTKANVAAENRFDKMQSLVSKQAKERETLIKSQIQNQIDQELMIQRQLLEQVNQKRRQQGKIIEEIEKIKFAQDVHTGLTYFD
jgi:hypothetical protein